MSTITKASSLPALEARLALIACGENSRPGKTQACESHRKKGTELLRITGTGAVDALAAAICGSRHNRACAPCTEKAIKMISVYNEGAE
ncbi:hypothetical protein [Streptomyces hirsutus]|uniref:hypothetical protein n=1 Tax=Streptomyces hirsutus TaxID=35620 RepID=UPI003333BAA7